jgi:FtsX extracellular domain
VSREEAVASFCLHIWGLSIPPNATHASPKDALAADVELLRTAGDESFANEVEALIEGFDSDGIEITVHLLDGISSSERQAIGERLRRHPGATKITFETKEEAANRFAELFKDQPELIENIDPGVLPESWRVLVPEGSETLRLDTELSAMPGVRSVSVAPPGYSEAVARAIGVRSRACGSNG